MLNNKLRINFRAPDLEKVKIIQFFETEFFGF